MAAKQEYESVPTQKAGVELRVTPGTKPDLPQDVVNLFYKLALDFYQAKALIEQTSEEQRDRRLDLIRYAQGIPGLRGLRSEPDDCGVLLVRKESVSYDPDLLKMGLGTSYQPYVTEELVATITIPLSLTTEEAIRNGITKLLQELGVPGQDVDKLLHAEVQLRVDEEKIEELLSSGRLELPEGARAVETTWAVEAEPLKKLKPVKRAKGGKTAPGA